MKFTLRGLSSALPALLVGAATYIAATSASALPPGNRFGPNGTATPIVRPTVSPYLALGPGGLNRTITTYFTFVRPQIYTEQQLSQQGTAINQLRQQLRLGRTPIYGQTGAGESEKEPMRSTGYESWYMQHQRHFGIGYRLGR